MRRDLGFLLSGSTTQQLPFYWVDMLGIQVQFQCRKWAPRLEKTGESCFQNELIWQRPAIDGQSACTCLRYGTSPGNGSHLFLSVFPRS